MDPKLKSTLLRLLSFLILVAFIVFVEGYIGWHELLAPWQSLPVSQLLLAIILVFLSYWVRAMRLYDYFHSEMHGAFTRCFKLMLQHNLLNNLLPMRSGELSFPLLMSRYFSIPLTRSLPTLLWFRLLDLHSLLGCGLLIAGTIWLDTVLTLAATVAWMLLPCLGYYWAYTPAQRILGTESGGRVRALLRHLLQSLPQSLAAFWRSWFWTLLNWILKLAIFAWILRLFLDTSFAAAWVGVTAGDLSSVLPIHGVAGIGTYEAGVVAGLLLFGITTEDGLQAAVNIHLFILATTLIGGALSLLLPFSKTGR